MKKYIFLFTVLMLSGCQQKISEETIQVIDVNATYPERELVLQDIAATLTEDANPVIMLVKHKS